MSNGRQEKPDATEMKATIKWALEEGAMKLFEKNDVGQADVTRANNEAISSILCKDMTVTGEVSFKGKTRVDGTVEGNMKGEYLVLSETGTINGDVDVVHFVCQGTVDGNIVAKVMEIKKSATINGRIETANLSMESGASLNSDVKTGVNDLSSATKKTPPQPVAKQELKTVVK